tara:strand:+ start:68 stop:238 length:171 start_codon:yes stop_codon:yes gene_type:complete
MENLNVQEWGVFVETSEGETLEVQLPEELAGMVAEFLLDAKSESVVGKDTNGKIKW